MSLKQEIETWVQALGHYDNNEFEEALRSFDVIADTSKILFNCGVIHATIGEHDRAVECYQRAIKLDQYLAVAYFQQGVSNFLVGDFEEALANFNDTLLYLRGNTYIDYEQLGLKFRLYSCEVLFNRGLCYIYLQQEGPGMQDFGFAQKEKMTPDHDVIDDAIREKAAGYTVFSIPVGVLYRPNEAKVKNLKTKDYLGKARLIATSNSQNITTGFDGVEKRQQLAMEMKAKDDRPPENISYAATNLVQRNLSSRANREREQSAPAVMGRNVFPPTPPPETEKPSKHSSTGSNNNNNNNLPIRTTSMRNPARNPPPPPLKREYDDVPRPGMLGRSQTYDMTVNRSQPSNYNRLPPDPSRDNSWPTERQYEPSNVPERPRIGTQRTASEPRHNPVRRQMLDRSASQRGPPPPQQQLPPPQQQPLFRETTPQRRFDSGDDTVDDVYQMYSTPWRRNPRRAPPERAYIDEEDEYVEGSEETVDEMSGFEPVTSSPMRPQSRSNRQSRKLDMRKIRVKVHANDDTRYIMVGSTIDFGDFESKIREKFGIKNQLRIKMEDEGDMITMADQDDLDMLIQSVRSMAKKENSEMGKMEIWISS